MDRRSKIIEIIQQVSHKNVVPEVDESLFDTGVLDSFTLADLVAGIEKSFGLKVPDSDLNPRKWDSIERIESYLDGHR